MTFHKTDIEVVNLEALDWEPACEVLPVYHNKHADLPAAWATWWERFCPCRPVFMLTCDACMEDMMSRTTSGTCCQFCGARVDTPLRDLCVRRERL